MVVRTAENLLPYNGEAFLYPGVFSPGESAFYVDTLLKNTPWQQLPIKIFGKEIMQPRLTAWYSGNSNLYRYSGLTMQPREWSGTLLEIKQRVETTCGHRFNSALLNLYRNGSDSMGWHRDNEKELGPKPVIASVSFGAERKFQLRDYAEKDNVISIGLTSGSVLLMAGQTQTYWEHRLPKTSGLTAARINLTFRNIV